MFENANWFLVLMTLGTSSTTDVPNAPIGPYFSQKACDAAYVEIVKDYPRTAKYMSHACVPVPTEGD